MIKKLSHIMVGLMICLSLFGQTESEILSQANKLFKNEKFVEATPLYLRLLSLSPKKHDYNYRYGTCLLFNSDRKQEALRYLKFATESSEVDPKAHYYLGKAYHLNYLFNDAVRSYNKFEEIVGVKETSEYQINRLIETCQNGRRLLMNYSEMIVFDKKEIEKDKFFRLYDTKEIGGTIVVTAEYQSKLDKKMGHIPLVFFAKNAMEVFYSSYGEDMSNGKEIYRRRREASGKWGNPQLVKGKVNTKYDEDFCYRSQDGKYLYFSSKGHNSMGGFDVFRSEYSETSDSFGAPENMDFAVSSPDDDIFFLVDANNENGYFASARQSEYGKLYVYKIRVDKLPRQLSVIAGVYESKITSSPAPLRVQVEDLEGKVIGKFKSDNNGQIILSFPKGGQYRYKMNLEGSSEVYIANVNIPIKKDIKPVRQSFVHFMENGNEVVRVLDRFDESISNKDDILAALFANKANLDPNSDKFDLNGLNNAKDTEEILAAAGANGMTMNEVATEMEGKARYIRKMEDNAGVIEKKTAAQIEEEIAKIESLNQSLKENATAYKNAESNSMTRQKLLTESKALLAEKKNSEDEIEDLLDINRKVQENLVLYKDLKQRAGDWEKKGAQLQQLLKEDKNAEALQLVALNKVIIKSAINDTVDDYQSVTSMDINVLDRDLSTLSSRKFNYETSSKDLRNNIDYMEKFLLEGKAEDPEKTKEQIELKKKDLIKIHDEIKNIENDLASKRVLKEELTDELSEFMELDNSPMPDNLVQLQTAKNHWDQVKSTPQDDGADYLAEVIRVVEEGGTTTDPQTAMTSEELIAMANPDYLEQQEAINNNAGMLPIDKAAALAEIELDNSEKLKAELQKTNEKLAGEPNNTTWQKEKENLAQLIKESEKSVVSYTDQIEQEKSKQIAETFDSRMIAESIDNTFDDVSDHIKDDSNMGESAKLQALKEHDEAYVVKVKTRQAELQERLSSEPNKLPEFQKELEFLSDILDQKESDIVQWENEIANLENVANTQESAFSKMSPKEQEMAILNELSGNYLDQKENFEDISEPTKDNLEAELALDNALLSQLDEKLSNINPQKQVDEKKTINRLKNDVLADIAKNQKEIEAIDAQVALVDPNQENAFAALSSSEQETLILEKVNSEYTSAKESLTSNSNSTTGDFEEELKLDKEMLSQLNSEKQQLNSETQSAEIKAIERIEQQLNEDILENELNLVSVKETNQELTERLLANYSSDVNDISDNQSMDELAKSKARVSLDETLIRNLETEKNKIADLFENNPDVQSLSLKVAQIDELIAEKSQLTASRKADIADLESQLAATDPADNTSNFAQLNSQEQENKIKEQIDWSYEEDKNEIYAISTSESEKINALIQLDKEAQNKLANEKRNLSAENQVAKVKAIERIEEKIQESLSNNQMSLLALPESSQELISRIAKTNTEQREVLLANTSLSELDRKKKEIALDEELVEILKNEQDKFERLGSANPQVSELRDKMDEIARVVSESQNALVLHQTELKSIESELAATNPNTNPDPNANPVLDISFNNLSQIEQEQVLIKNVDPNYTSKKAELDNTSNPTSDQLEESIDLNKTLLSNISNLKNNLDPTTDAAKIDAIERIEKKTETLVNDFEVDLLGQSESELEILTRLANNEINQIEEIRNSSTESEIEKVKRVKVINQQIIRELENEKAKVDDLSLRNPTEEGLSQKSFAIASVINDRQAEMAILDQEMEKIQADLAATGSMSQLKKGFVSVEELRTEILKEDDNFVRDNEYSIEGLNDQLNKLEKYEKQLIDLDTAYQYFEETQGADFSTERQLVSDELAIVGTKKRQASISIGELETEAIASTSNQIEAKYDDASLNKIVKEENELRKTLESDDLVSMKEARKIEKKLIDVIGERMDKENSITAKIVDKTADENEDKLKKLKSLETSSITERVNVELAEKRFEELTSQSRVLEQKAKKSNSPVEQSELLNQAMAKQQEASDLLEMSYVDTRIDNLTKGKINSLMTNADLEARKRNLLVEEANNAAKLSEIDAQIKNESNSKKLDAFYVERDELVEKRSQLNEEIAQVDKKISAAPTSAEATLPDNAKSKELTYLEEREIAESDSYKELSTAAYDAQFLEKEISNLLKGIDQDKIDAQALVQKSLTDSDKDIDDLILKKIEGIQEKEVKIEELKLKLTKRQSEMKDLFPQDPDDIAKINNMLARGVDPMSKGDAVDYVAIPDNGFEIVSSPATTAQVKAKPIETETPTGLMYRVQVGAFSKPVAEDQFNEFTPVSAEKRSNGILVYMAGYFVGNDKAFEAQKSIRSIGYTDAFVVAYCDGKRITLGEARRLEKTKACTPIEINQIAIQANAPAPTDTTEIVVTELDYYKGIGAAPAFPVETKGGLFFTVQLGVYNRPVDKKTLKNMSPLITKRLPNGQIRYSAGVYVSVEEAFPKRDQAFEKGITDAYITAYFKGERISLKEAEDLLQSEGTVVIEKTAVGIVKDVEARLEATKKLNSEIQEIVKNKMVEGMNIQLVSKKQYNEFPRDVLNRFNSHASFYYDINDKRVKSNLYTRIDDIPQVYFLRNEIDTSYISDQERINKVIKQDLRNVSFRISSTQLGGDLTDMLLRLNYRKEFVQEGENIRVILHEVPPSKVQNISDRLRTLKIRADVIDPAR